MDIAVVVVRLYSYSYNKNLVINFLPKRLLFVIGRLVEEPFVNSFSGEFPGFRFEFYYR